MSLTLGRKSPVEMTTVSPVLLPLFPGEREMGAHRLCRKLPRTFGFPAPGSLQTCLHSAPRFQLPGGCVHVWAVHLNK